MKGFLLALTVWIIASFSLHLNQMYLPDILGTFQEAKSEVLSGNFIFNLGATLARVTMGLLGGLLIGSLIGGFVALNSSVRSWVWPLIEFIRSIPTSMLFPIFIVALGVGEVSKAGIVITATFPIIAVSIVSGFIDDNGLRDRDDYLNLHSNKIPRSVLIYSKVYSALPSIIAGLKLSLSIALVLTIVTEMFFVASSGVGWAAYQSYQDFNIDKMYFYIIATGVIGLVVNIIFDNFVSKSSPR